MIKITKKTTGIILIILGIIFLIIPLIPGAWLVFIGLELLGLRLLFQEKARLWFKNNKIINISKENKNLIIDLFIIILSFIVTVILWNTSLLEEFLANFESFKFVGSFLGGMAFVSVFTAAPAIVILVDIAKTESIFIVALFGGLGALIGDLIIFRFIKNRISSDITYLTKKIREEKFFLIFQARFFRRIMPILGALIILSPLPDELGIALMGLSHISNLTFILTSFGLNFLSILALGLFSKIFI